MNIERVKNIIEAIVFAAEGPVSLETLAQAVEEVNLAELPALLESLSQDWRGANKGFQLVEVAGGWQFRTKPEFGAYVQRLHHDRPSKLSRPSLETLSVIAYKQPITRPEVEDLRGVDSGAVVKNLLERNLIKIIGKKDTPGRPVVYGTTPRFLEVFSLKDLGSLPSLRDLKDLEDGGGEQLALPVLPGVEGEPPVEANVSDSERRRQTREMVRGMLSILPDQEGEGGLVGGLPPPAEDDENVMAELDRALKRRKEVEDRTQSVMDEAEREYIDRVTEGSAPSEEADDTGNSGSGGEGTSNG